ncbi:MAG: YbjN domain-containing protein [Actinomycetota bacterium]
MSSAELLPPFTPDELDTLEAHIDTWLRAEARDNPMIDAIERGEKDERRWYVRLRGDEKDVWTAWWTINQRTFRFETFLMPAPEENEGVFYQHLLVRNRELTGMHLEIGDEHAIFLAGSLPVRAVTDAELDRVLGSMWAYVEKVFRPALRIGFASRVDI